MRLIFPTLLILISGIIFFLFTNPLREEVITLKNDVKSYDTALSDSNTLAKQQGELLDTYNGISKEDKDRLSKFLPSSVNNIQFILEIEKIASNYGMPIKDIKFEYQVEKENKTKEGIILSDSIVDNRPYGVFPIEFSTYGKYDSFVSFLEDLERNLRLVDVKSISFDVPTNTKIANPDIYEFSLKVDTYWLK